ncbi:hypothetical protein A2U01_0015025 [Trifolium medium]|uniref:Uncharacterized protein n=1 Tax=Trifolium medium TaxID=97028 RepID=A0A392N2M9_9FABA|nr:hypothetical protein [Trifolium medium]
MSGGMLKMWNAGLFNFKFSFTCVGFLGVCVEWKEEVTYIVDVYSPCNLAGGDFNAILNLEEAKVILDSVKELNSVNLLI